MTNITDVGQLQNMVKKRDSIIVELKGELKPVTAESIDYEEVCIQLKAATYEITRLEEELLICQGARDHWEVIAKKSGDDAIELSKQLDQQTAEEAKKGLEALKAGDLTIVGKTQTDYENEIKLLEEKLALCDKFYKVVQKDLKDIWHIVNKNVT